MGLIPGGIVNGIAGNLDDEPVLDTECGYDWRTAEYWSPHNANFVCVALGTGNRINADMRTGRTCHIA